MKRSKNSDRRLRLGVVANEFFHLRMGRAGGFGWAARQVARCFNGNPSLGVDVVFLTNSPDATDGRRETSVHDTPLLFLDGGRLANTRRLRAQNLDLLLMIDYRPNYRFFGLALPRTPVVVWVRDPKAAADKSKIGTLRIPGADGVRPKGVEPIDCTSLAQLARLSRLAARPLLFASPAPHLAEKMKDAYGVGAREVSFLPNPVELDAGEIFKSERPRVIFMSRLDPLKRPWLFVEIAERFPQVEFLFLGKSHFRGEGAWEPKSLPANVRPTGHVDGAEKVRLLSSAWALVNTAIHEGLAVSFLEALACETPLVSCQNPGGVVSRFGIYTGGFEGDGLEGVPRFVEGLSRLLEDGELRARLGREGRRWVAETHSPARFLAAFDELCARASLSRGNGGGTQPA